MPGISTELRVLINVLNIKAKVIDADPGTGIKEVDERIVIYVSENNLQKNVARSDIEREAERNGHVSIARIQNNKITDRLGSFDIPAGTGIPAQGVGTWIGVSGNDKITSGDHGSAQLQVLACEIDHYGTGVTQKRDIERTTYLGKNPVNVFSAWTEVSSDCSPEYQRQVRFFDNCPGPDGKLGTSDDDASGQTLYEATQWVRNARKSDPDANPFKTEIFLDLSTATLVDLDLNTSGVQSRCTESDRISDSADFLVNGRIDGPKELALKSSTSANDIGNGPGKVPRKPSENAADNSTDPVSGIPFIEDDLSDFQFTRTCEAEYGTNVALPTGFSGTGTLTGNVDYYRDYNRRETYFSRNTLEYILNYALVLDPNIYGHAYKGRGQISTTYGTAMDGDGWYKFTETCEREITHPERENRQRACSVVYPTHPHGVVYEQRDGTGYYNQTTPANPVANGPTRTRIDWNDWYETNNTCFYATQTQTRETRTILVNYSCWRCNQAQYRTRIVTTNHHLNGGVYSETTYNPNWTNVGSVGSNSGNYDSYQSTSGSGRAGICGSSDDERQPTSNSRVPVRAGCQYTCRPPERPENPNEGGGGEGPGNGSPGGTDGDGGGGCVATFLVNMRDIEPRKEDDGFDGAFLSP